MASKAKTIANMFACAALAQRGNGGSVGMGGFAVAGRNSTVQPKRLECMSAPSVRVNGKMLFFDVMAKRSEHIARQRM